jgi:hypothetical protein
MYITITDLLHKALCHKLIYVVLANAIFTLTLQPSAGYGLLMHEVFVIKYNDAPKSLGFL